MYNINLLNIISWLLPPFLRGSTIRALLSTLLTVKQQLYYQLQDYQSQKLYQLHITSQVIYLEKLLNDQYDPNLRRIYIDEYYESIKVVLYNKSENEHPVYIYNKYENTAKTYLRNKSESNYNYYFIVQVPYVIYYTLLLNNNNKLNRMKANLNKYKAYGTFYMINPF